jgi:hypothetical protein
MECKYSIRALIKSLKDNMSKYHEYDIRYNNINIDTYKDIIIRKSFVYKFIRKYCNIGDIYWVGKKIFNKVLGIFIEENYKKINLSFVSMVKNDIDIKVLGNNYSGIDLNIDAYNKYLKEDIVKRKRKEEIYNRKNQNYVDRKDVCISASCNLTVGYFEELYKNFDKRTQSLICKRCVVKNIRKIEKILYNNYSSSNHATRIKIGVAVYYGSVMNQKDVGKLLNVTEVSLRLIFKNFGTREFKDTRDRIITVMKKKNIRNMYKIKRFVEKKIAKEEEIFNGWELKSIQEQNDIIIVNKKRITIINEWLDIIKVNKSKKELMNMLIYLKKEIYFKLLSLSIKREESIKERIKISSKKERELRKNKKIRELSKNIVKERTNSLILLDLLKYDYKNKKKLLTSISYLRRFNVKDLLVYCNRFNYQVVYKCDNKEEIIYYIIKKEKERFS